MPQDGYPSENAGFEIERGVLPNSSILFVEASAKWSANNGNTSYFLAAEDRVDAAFNHANSVFANANSYITYNEAVSVTQNNSIVASFIHANSAYQSQNATGQYANAAFIHANSGFIHANSGFTHANAAFANANSYITYNEAVSVTQNNSITAAFVRANNSLNANTGGEVTGNITVGGTITPNADVTWNLGSPSNRWHSLFVGAGTIDIGGLTISNTKVNNVDTARFGGVQDIRISDATVSSFRQIASQANSAFDHANAAFANANSYITYNEAVSVSQNNSIAAAFIRANNSLDANNGGSVSGTILSTANVRAVYVVANSGFTSAAGGSKLDLTDIGLVTVDVAGQQFKFGASGIESSPGIYGGSFGGNKLSLSNETNLISNRYDTVKIQTGTDGTTVNEWVFANNSLTAPGGITANGFTAGGINVVPTLALSFNTANAAFASANNIDGVNATQNNNIIVALNTANASYAQGNAAAGVDTTQNNSISAAFLRANNSLDANNGGIISGDIVITGNLTANIVGGTF